MPARRPRPYALFPLSAARAVRGVLTDIDDTLTTDGAITPDALGALRQLRAAGLKLIAVTGRSLGWSRAHARDWPLDAIVAENGALALWRRPSAMSSDAPHVGARDDEDDGEALVVEYAQDAATRARNTLQLRAAAERVLREVPGATLAADSAGRVTDIAFDHAEHARLDADGVARIVATLQASGLTASVSSIHVNAWIGDHDKVSGARWIARRLHGIDLDADAAHWLAIGDSANDQALFAHFECSVGVANLLRWADAIDVWPTWITQAARGAGFAEMAERLLTARFGR